MTDLLRMLLDLRERLAKFDTLAKDYGVEFLPEIEQMQTLERKAFQKISEWSKA